MSETKPVLGSIRLFFAAHQSELSHAIDDKISDLMLFNGDNDDSDAIENGHRKTIKAILHKLCPEGFVEININLDEGTMSFVPAKASSGKRLVE